MLNYITSYYTEEPEVNDNVLGRKLLTSLHITNTQTFFLNSDSLSLMTSASGASELVFVIH